MSKKTIEELSPELKEITEIMTLANEYSKCKKDLKTIQKKMSDYNTLAERREQLFMSQKDDFTDALVAAIDASNALGLDHSVELLLDSMIDDFCKEELNFSVGNYILSKVGSKILNKNRGESK